MLPPIWKECYVLSCLAIQSLATGISMGLPAVLTPVITSNRSDIFVTKEEASWIASSYAITGPIGYLIMPSLMQMFGRRIVNMALNFVVILGAIIIATASDLTGLIAGRAIQGIAFCIMFMSVAIVAEYSHPKRRGLFALLTMICIFVGILLSHGLIIVLTWRSIVWLSVIPAAIGVLAPLSWPDTPYWFAYKGRFDDCQNAFEWLRGRDVETKIEFEELMSAQREIRNQNCLEGSSSFTKIVSTFRSKTFLKQLGIVTVIIIIKHSFGVYYLFSYIVQIMGELTGNKSNALYYSLGSDFMKVIGLFVSLGLERMFSRRRIVLVSGYLSCALLALLCVSKYLFERKIILTAWLPATVLIIYSLVVSSGAIPLTTVLKSELFSLEYKGVGISASGVINALAAFLGIKLTSNMLNSLKVEGTFAVYATISFISLLIVHLSLPETKDKSLQNIENNFKTVNSRCDRN